MNLKFIYAEVAKLVDAPDSKSGVAHPTYRFESGLRQIPQKFFCKFLGCFYNSVLTGYS